MQIRTPEVAHNILAEDVGKHEDKAGMQFNTAKMEKAILNMISTANSTKSSNVTDELRRSEVASFAELMLEQISDMEGLINTTRSAAVRILQGHQTAHQICESNKSSGTSAVGIMKADRSSKSTMHKNCRSLEKKAKEDYLECQATLSLLRSAKETSCTVYTKHAAKQPSCDLLPEHINTYTAWLEAHKKFVTNELVLLSAEKMACDNATTAFDKKTVECEGVDGESGLRKKHTDQKARCDRHQSALEAATCSYAAEHMSVCQEHANCFEAYQHAWDSDKPELQAQESSFKHEWWMLQRMRCYLGVLHKADGGTVDAHLVDLCKNQTHDTDSFDLPWFDEAAAPGQCVEPTKPCSAKYESDEYGSLPAEAPAEQCNACSSPTPYILGGEAYVYEDAIFDACPDGTAPAPVYDKDSRLAVEAFIASLDVPSGSMFLGNWFMGSGNKGCAMATKLGYLTVSGKERTWAEMDDVGYQEKVSAAWGGNANCDVTPDADGKSYDPPVMYVGPDKSVDLGNCLIGGCGFNLVANFTKDVKRPNSCFNNRNEGCKEKLPVICSTGVVTIG